MSTLAPHPVLGRYYDASEERQETVTQLFDDTAPYYDIITEMMSFGTGARYRAEVLQAAGLAPGHHLLDLACGTCQIAAAAAEMVAPDGRVVAVDPSVGMRTVGSAYGTFELREGTATEIPAGDSSFDFLTMGYALRHAADLIAAFREMHRVLRPGGKVIILEITPPKNRVQRALVKAYLKHIVPVGSLAITGDHSAMRLMSYYWDSIEQCVDPAAILDAMSQAGFETPERTTQFDMLSAYVAVA